MGVSFPNGTLQSQRHLTKQGLEKLPSFLGHGRRAIAAGKSDSANHLVGDDHRVELPFGMTDPLKASARCLSKCQRPDKSCLFIRGKRYFRWLRDYDRWPIAVDCEQGLSIEKAGKVRDCGLHHGLPVGAHDQLPGKVCDSSLIGSPLRSVLRLGADRAGQAADGQGNEKKCASCQHIGRAFDAKRMIRLGKELVESQRCNHRHSERRTKPGISCRHQHGGKKQQYRRRSPPDRMGKLAHENRGRDQQQSCRKAHEAFRRGLHGRAKGIGNVVHAGRMSRGAAPVDHGRLWRREFTWKLYCHTRSPRARMPGFRTASTGRRRAGHQGVA